MSETLKTEGQYGRFLISPEERPTSEIPYHYDTAPGVRRVFLEKKLLPETDTYVIVRTAKHVKPDQRGYIDIHAHNVNSIYLFMGEDEGLKGLLAEVMIGDETYEVSSPATVYIPKGVPHTTRLIEGSGHFTHIVLGGDYRESLAEPVALTEPVATAEPVVLAEPVATAEPVAISEPAMAGQASGAAAPKGGE